MKEQFVTHEIALKLKELGFVEPCLAVYRGPDLYINNTGGYLYEIDFDDNSSMDDQSNHWITAPLWQQAIDWLFENKGIKILEISNGNWEVYVIQNNEYFPYKSKEEAISKFCNTLK